MFGKSYAKYYDIIYSDKDYEYECDFLEKVFQRYSRLRIKTILDISCGTGGRAIPLANRGYTVTGVDSSRAMVRIAIEKARRAACKVEFKVGSMTNLPVTGKYDACFSMFDSIDYLGSEKDVEYTFKEVASRLTTQGIFLVQYWNQDAVLALGVEQRHKVVRFDDLEVVRLTDSELQKDEGTCVVSFRIIVMREKEVVEDFRERHFMRYFTSRKMKALLESAGFLQINTLKPFEVVSKADAGDWSVIAVAIKGEKRSDTS